MPNKENLKPFKKGFDERRNLEGGPKKIILTEAIDEVDKEWLKRSIKALIKQADKGNVKAIQELFDRYFGKSGQKLELSNPDGTFSKPIINVPDKETGELLKKLIDGQ